MESYFSTDRTYQIAGHQEVTLNKNNSAAEVIQQQETLKRKWMLYRHTRSLGPKETSVYVGLFERVATLHFLVSER